MAESNQKPMSISEFREKKAGASTYDKPTASSSSKVSANSSNSPSSRSSQTRPASANITNSARRSVSSENLAGDRYGPAPDQRQSKVKLLREQQADERRRKNEERRAAFEERKKKKELEEKERWAALKEQATKHSLPNKANTAGLKPGSGRRLPTVPTEGNAKRPGSAVETATRPSSLPKPLTRPASANPAKSPSQSSTGSISSGSTPKQSPATTPSSLQPKTALGKSVSASNLTSAATRRPSAGAVQQRPSSGTKSRTRTSSTNASAQALDKPSSRNSASHESLLPPGGKLTKSHSTSSLHKVGHHKPAGDKSQKTETKPKAGVTDEATAKQALAERRKKAREEAERQAALDKERQEAERLKREEEERLRAEEEAKEEARMRELAELLRKQEEERLQLAAEEKERKEREEAERVAAEKKRKDEEEQRAKEEEDRKAQEDEERRKKEEAARLERKRRVEQIMSRTRQTASPTTAEESNSSMAGNEAKDHSDPDDTKRKVNEILQKVKGASGRSSPVSSLEENVSVPVKDAGEEQGNNNESKTAETVPDTSESLTQSFASPDNSFDGSTSDVHVNGVNSSAVDNCESESLAEDTLSSSPPLIVSQQESSFTVMTSRSTNHEQHKETVLFQYSEESSVTINKENYDVNGTDQALETEKLASTEAAMASF